jgi:thiamine monophosphate synthase
VSSAFPSVSPAGERRQARLADARLWVVGDARAEGLESLLRATSDGSADILELRDDMATEDALRAAADVYARVSERSGALFVVASLAGLAVQVGADGVHLTPADLDPDGARLTVGPDLLVGRTANQPGEVDAAAEQDLDVITVGPGAFDRAVHSATGLWFAATTPAAAQGVLAAGARRIAVQVDDLAPDAAAVCWELRQMLARHALH